MHSDHLDILPDTSDIDVSFLFAMGNVLGVERRSIGFFSLT